ncbi:class I tRNA ligase family protein [Streptomyces millisiae]|uniref:Class I tRNA ligase family protein n=1 Tax=Streptomyces millisiae TaxID=3075542 RepID=A0ABU2LNP3_9ACTN|nr:class I tRNA ligase family protein [Streptomyces sp. DSM 44918]MDT0319201.1 class I tRNA ligase family protein [Streptomyces sp. DSM 44918]
MSGPLWITASPPGAHGELHVGHLAGPYVAADVLSRFLRAEGRTVRLTTATAQHTDAVELRARRASRDPGDIAEGYHEAIVADLAHARVAFDLVTHPAADVGFHAWLGETFRRLHAEGLIVARTRPLPYCPACETWLYGTLVTGGCPRCGATRGGDVCRACSRPGGELVEPRCAVCAAPPTTRRLRRLHLLLEPLRDQLTDYWSSSDLSPRLAALCEDLVEDALPSPAVTRPSRWGLPVPVEGYADQRIDTAFENAAAQLHAWGPDDRPPPEHAIAFAGFSHAFDQAVVLPALQIARGLKLPTTLRLNDPYELDGRPLSHGSRHGAWVLDLVTEWGSDTLRRHVLRDRPGTRPTAFRAADLERSWQVLREPWEAWLERLLGAVRTDCGGVVPAVEPGGAGWERLRDRLLRTAADLREAYGPEEFDPRRVLALLDEVVHQAADFGHANAHHHRDRPEGARRHQAALVAQLAVAAALAAWAWPVMPEGAARLAAALRLPAVRRVDEHALTPPPPGTRLPPPPAPVFGS